MKTIDPYDIEPQAGGLGMTIEEALDSLKEEYPEVYNSTIITIQSSPSKIDPEYSWVLSLKPIAIPKK